MWKQLTASNLVVGIAKSIQLLNGSGSGGRSESGIMINRFHITIVTLFLASLFILCLFQRNVTHEARI